MKTTLTFEIECGETTCASSPGKFCRFLRNDMKGNGSCHMFGRVFDQDGWIQRHPLCMAATK